MSVELPYINKEGGFPVIVLETKGHRLKVKRGYGTWSFKIQHESKASTDTAWAEVKKPEHLKNLPITKQIREVYGHIYGGQANAMIDYTVKLLQERSDLWPEPEDRGEAPDHEPTVAEKLVTLVLSSGAEVFRDQNDDEYILFRSHFHSGVASVASVAENDTQYSAMSHTLRPTIETPTNNVEKTATPATLATPQKKETKIGFSEPTNLFSTPPKMASKPSFIENTFPSINSKKIQAVSLSPATLSIKKYYRLTSKKLKSVLSVIMHKSSGEVPGGDALNSAVTLLSGYAREHPRIHLYNRVGVQPDGSWWLDLTDDDFRAVRITDDGWGIVEDAPVMFRRYSHQLPLGVPEQNGSVLDMLEFTNFGSVDDQLLYMVFGVLETLVPEIPHVVLYIYGAKGTVKSTAMVAIKAIFDNSSMAKGLLNMHRDSNKLGQNLDHHYLAYFDNISHIDEDQSDLLCRAVTGAGIANRLLYSDDDDFIRQFMRCVAINGINVAARKPDLFDRLVLLETKKVPRSERKEDTVIMKMIYEKAPGILFDALNVIVRARQLMKAGISVDGGLSRMADAMKWGVAITESLGIDRDKFLVAYHNNVINQEADSIKSSIVGELLIQLLEVQLPSWRKTLEGYVKPEKTEVVYSPSVLFLELKRRAEDTGVNIRVDFPSDPTRMSAEINEFAPNLPSVGFRLITSRTGSSGRKMTFTRLIPTKLDEVMEVRRVDNDWLGCDDLRDYIEKKNGAVEGVPVQVEQVKVEQPKPIERPRDPLSELLKRTLDLFPLDRDEALGDEELFSLMEKDQKLSRTESTKIISILMRDGTIFSPRPGFYKRA